MIRNELEKIYFTSVNIDDDFWSPRLKNHQETTIKA